MMLGQEIVTTWSLTVSVQLGWKMQLIAGAATVAILSGAACTGVAARTIKADIDKRDRIVIMASVWWEGQKQRARV